MLGILGGGAHLVRTVEQDLIVLVGLGASLEKFTHEREDVESLEAMIGCSYTLYALGGNDFTVDASAVVFPSLTVSERVRAEVKIDLPKELFKDFYFGVQFFDSYDSSASQEEGG